MKRKETKWEKDDLYHHRLGLACIALAEVPASVRRRMSDWVDRLTKEAYELYRRPVTDRSASEVEYFKPSIVAMGRLNGRIGNKSEVWFEVLGEVVATPEVVSVLMRAITDDADSNVRRSTARALSRLGEAAATPEVLSALVRAVTDDADSNVRWDATRALGQLGEAAARAEVVGAGRHGRCRFGCEV